MKKVLLIVLAVLILGGGAWIVRNLTDTPPEVPQVSPTATAASSHAVTPLKVLRGTFNEQDAVHKGRGDVTASGRELKFAENFHVTQGPDVFVYLAKTADGKNLDGAVSLGRLHSNDGAQTYTLPANYTDFQAVVIYCRSFHVTFSVATLH